MLTRHASDSERLFRGLLSSGPAGLLTGTKQAVASRHSRARIGSMCGGGGVWISAWGAVGGLMKGGRQVVPEGGPRRLL
jgi:hypothetical protein